jgi:hypothetical protein
MITKATLLTCLICTVAVVSGHEEESTKGLTPFDSSRRFFSWLHPARIGSLGTVEKFVVAVNQPKAVTTSTLSICILHAYYVFSLHIEC